MKKLWFSAFLALLFASASVVAQEQQVVTYDDIDNAPVIGKVAAFNPYFGFMIVKASNLQPAIAYHESNRTVFHRVTVRRNGVLQATGYIEEIEGNTVTVQLLDLRRDGANRPLVGDDVIVLAPQAQGK